MKIRRIFSFFILAVAFKFSLFPALANESPEPQHNDVQWLKTIREHLTKPYTEGSWDIYLTGYAWHVGPLFNGKDLNARAYGAGIGKHWTDSNGQQDLLYAFVFRDSYKNVQPIAGYAHLWFTQPLGGLSAGGGFTTGLTARRDMLRYAPLPFLLPVGALRYEKLSLMGTVIPRRQGALGLIWLRYAF